MRELVERGHIFIAQPPLYKIRKGKHEQYLIDDDELNQYQTQNALEEASLHVNADAPGISGKALEGIVNDYREVQTIIKRHSRQYPEDILGSLINLRALSIEDMQTEAKVSAWIELLQENVASANLSGALYAFSVVHDTEENVYVPVITSTVHGIMRKVTLSIDFFKSLEYKAIYSFGETVEGLFEEGAYVQRGEKSQEAGNFKEAIDWLMADAMKGHYLQRYKGLGEMNPEQLWETTMDPEYRRMLQVTIEDAMGADQLFSTLMGDQVEPRREFIETNALTVSNLDI
jgi:DNA gyrase subunit B